MQLSFNKRFHHYKKEVLSRECAHWKTISSDTLDFLECVCDYSSGELSENQWKKLYALLANLCKLTHVNYRVYLTIDGYLLDTTSHRVVDAAQLDAEMLHGEVEEKLEATTSDERLKELKRLKLETAQLDVKIKLLQEKKAEVDSRYAQLKQLFIEEEI